MGLTYNRLSLKLLTCPNDEIGRKLLVGSGTAHFLAEDVCVLFAPKEREIVVSFTLCSREHLGELSGWLERFPVLIIRHLAGLN